MQLLSLHASIIFFPVCLRVVFPHKMTNSKLSTCKISKKSKKSISNPFEVEFLRNSVTIKEKQVWTKLSFKLTTSS